MKNIIEDKFIHEGHTCVVLFTTMGHRCGYVAVTKDSPLFGVYYSDKLNKPELLQELNQSSLGKRGIIPLFCWDGEDVTPEVLFNVHGGITYSATSTEYPITTEEQTHWFGFDCAHYNDAMDIAAANKYFGIEHTSKYIRIPTGSIRSKEYVTQECKSLAEQIACVESTY